MINLYQRFIPHVSENQAIVHQQFTDRKKKNKMELKWTEDLENIFENCNF